MCDRCRVIDHQLVTFQRLRATVDDKLAQALMAIAVENLQSERATLHPGDTSKTAE
jgi:hypothetical protein